MTDLTQEVKTRPIQWAKILEGDWLEEIVWRKGRVFGFLPYWSSFSSATGRVELCMGRDMQVSVCQSADYCHVIRRKD